MVAVGREVVPAVGAHRDDRVEEASRLVHRERQLAHVRVGHVALVRRRLDLVDGQRGENSACPPSGSR